ncbi:MAG TPA: dienelactone hydrolase family protein [Roseateles sp.]|nr:dienelactone hydrolase family protein [Roseateles sp.]
MGERITISTPAGSFGAYLARPTAARAPAIAVMQEIFGINADMRATCDRLAAQGFLAACPDLFWRLEPGVELTDGSEAEWKKGFALYQAFDFDAGVGDAAATLDFLRTLPGSSGRVGIVGYCLGGLMSFRTAARHAPDAAVAYYGGGTERYVEEGRDMKSPLLMHLAGADEYMSAEAQARIHAVLGGKPNVEIHTYPGCQHAFARNQGQHYDAEAAALANARTQSFFQQHLL